MSGVWMQDAKTATEYHCACVGADREFILRLMSGVGLPSVAQRFATDRGIRVEASAAFMSGLQPARFFACAPDSCSSEDWRHEEPMETANLSVILSVGGSCALERPTGARNRLR